MPSVIRQHIASNCFKCVNEIGFAIGWFKTIDSIEDIYFLKIFYLVQKNQYFTTIMENDIFTSQDEIYLLFTKKSKCSSYFILQGE